MINGESTNVSEDGSKNLWFSDAEEGIVVVWVGAVVDDAVHVEVEVVEFRDALVIDQLETQRVALGDPSEELR